MCGRVEVGQRGHRVVVPEEVGDGMLTNDLVDLAITNTGGAGEAAEGRSTEVEGSRADGATRRRRKGGTGSPGEGGNAAILQQEEGQLSAFRTSRLRASPIRRDPCRERGDAAHGLTHLLNILTMIKRDGMVDVQRKRWLL